MLCVIFGQFGLSVSFTSCKFRPIEGPTPRGGEGEERKDMKRANEGSLINRFSAKRTKLIKKDSGKKERKIKKEKKKIPYPSGVRVKKGKKV